MTTRSQREVLASRHVPLRHTFGLQGVSLLTTTTFPATIEALWSPSMA
jgi:hypothetical protein